MTNRRDVDQMGGIRRVKKIREDRAQKEVQKAKNEVDRRYSELDRTKRSLEDFKNSKSDRAQSLFQEIQGKAVSIKDIQRYNGALAALDEEQQQLAGKVDTARSNVSSAERELVQARDHHKVQAKNHRKIQEVHDTLKEQYKQGMIKAEERNAEDDFIYKGK